MLILLLLPIVVLPWEGRRPPAAIYAILATIGALFAFTCNGLDGAAMNIGSGLACLILLLMSVSAIRSATGLQILTGGQIKLLSSGAIWLGTIGSLAMITLTGAVLFTIAIFHRVKGIAHRPDTGAVAAAMILCVGVGQLMFLA
ncbi:hypothetical protein WBP07_31195 [Novosphingobium sp. BL-8A]|uniref:hypothetical protein n=1 Tax=Novosphingobium sp. BL-8A TaxID=3127639 RepID=UPI00375817EB